MSSSRRRGRSPGLSAQPVPPTGVEPQGFEAPAETPAVESAEASESEDQFTGTDESVSALESAAAQQPEDRGVSEAEPAAEAAPGEEPQEETQDEAVQEETQDASRNEAPLAVSEATDTVTAEAVQESAPAEVPDTAPAVERVEETVAETAEAVAQAAPLPAPVESVRAESADRPAPERIQIGASFGVTSLAPITEINAKLFAFARGEGEAALAHFQALARAKSPAEAIRLQVTEMQRAADASLTCFSEIVRSANRLGDSVRWQ